MSSSCGIISMLYLLKIKKMFSSVVLETFFFFWGYNIIGFESMVSILEWLLFIIRSRYQLILWIKFEFKLLISPQKILSISFFKKEKKLSIEVTKTYWFWIFWYEIWSNNLCGDIDDNFKSECVHPMD